MKNIILGLKNATSSFKLKTQLFIMIGLIVIMITGFIGYIFFARIHDSEIKNLETSIQQYSSLATILVNGDKINWEQTKKGFQRFVQTDKRIKGLYILQQTDKQYIWKFLFDTPIPNVKQADPGELYDVSEFKNLKFAFNRPVIDDVCDKWGCWLSSYSPVIDSKGNSVYVVGIDMAMNDIKEKEMNIIKTSVLTCIVFIILALILSRIFSGSLTKPIDSIIAAAKEIGGGNFEYKIEVSSKNEIGFLAKTINSMTENIKRNFHKLTTINRTANILNSTLELEQAVTIALNLILEVTKSLKGALFIFSNDEKRIDSIRIEGANYVKMEENAVIIEDKMITRTIDDDLTQNVKQWMDTLGYNQYHILSVKDKRKGVFFIDSEIIDSQFINTLMNQVSLCIDNLQLLEVKKQQLKMEQELHVANTVQSSMLPDYAPDILTLDVSGYLMPAANLGGDYYDYFKISDSRFGLAVGDVNGHGITASLLMAMAKSCLFVQGRLDPNVIPVMNALNEMVYGGLKKRLFMTFIYSIFNIDDNTVTLSSAGHHLPYLYRKETKKLEAINAKPLYPLGVRETVKYKETTFSVNPGDILVYYTDGIIESKNIHEEEFGFDKFEQLIVDNAHLSSSDLNKLLVNKYKEWIKGRELAEDIDDMTIVVVRVKDPNQPEPVKMEQENQAKLKTGFLTLIGR